MGSKITILAEFLQLLATRILCRESKISVYDSFEEMREDPNSNLLTVVKLAIGTGYHCFDYYDKVQMDPAGNYTLSMEVGIENRSPRPEDVIKIGMINYVENNRKYEFGKTHASNWKQGNLFGACPC